MNYNELPAEIQAHVKSKLSAYSEAFVERNDGKLTYLASAYIDNSKKADDFCVYTYFPEDVFTKEEIAENYSNLTKAFAAMPVNDAFWN